MPPRSAKSRSSPRIQRMPSGSRPLAGSSRISTWGRRAARGRARAAGACRASTGLHALAGGALVEADAASAARRRASRSTPIIWARDGERLAAAAARVLGARVEQHADAPARVRRARGRAARAPSSVPASGVGEPDQHPHRRRLAGAVGSEEAGHGAGLAAERDVADHGAPAEALRESVASIMAPASGAAAPRDHRPPVDAGIDFGRGSRRASGVRWALTMRRWQMLPGGLLRGAGAPSARRATGSSTSTMFVLALVDRRARVRRQRATSTPSRWRSRPRARRCSRCVALWWRRRCPFAVALIAIVPGVVSAFAAGAGADRALQRRASAARRRAIVVLHRRWRSPAAWSSPLVYPDDERPCVVERAARRSLITGVVVAWGLFARAQRDLAALAARARAAAGGRAARARRAGARGRAAADRARDARRARAPALAAVACTRARWSSGPTRRRRRSPRRPA